ncbi:MAG: hypothetical protein IKL10_02210 [Clostridia bacterium]|nr:hypothetical protein [Clostridia bacterium]
MKREDISKVISNIDDSFIEEAAVPQKKKSIAPRYIGIAASFAVVILIGAVILGINRFVAPSPLDNGEETTVKNLLEPGIGEQTGSETVTEPAIEIAPAFPENEMAVIPQWVDLITPEKYREVKVGDITYSTQNYEITEDNVLSFLADAEMSGYDIYEDKTYTINAKVYSIKNINSECAVAVKIGDENKYYVYVNVWYVPETLQELIDALNLRETLSFGKAYADRIENNEQTDIIYADFDDSIVWDMILDDTTVKNIAYDRFYEKIVGISVDIPLLGYKNISLGVTKDGYIITNILGTQKCFFIGAEKAEAFGKYLKENVKYKELVTVFENPDGTIPGKGEEVTGQSTPGYNPNAPEMISPPYNPQTDSAPPENTAEAITPIPDDFIVEETTKS